MLGNQRRATAQAIKTRLAVRDGPDSRRSVSLTFSKSPTNRPRSSATSPERDSCRGVARACLETNNHQPGALLRPLLLGWDWDAGAPRSRPSVLMSSSISGQWILWPPPAIFQLRRCSALAWNRRGYQASGTEIVRPSFSRTLTVSGSNVTSATRSSAASAKIPIPSLRQVLLVGFQEISFSRHHPASDSRCQVYIPFSSTSPYSVPEFPDSSCSLPIELDTSPLREPGSAMTS